MDLLRLKNSSNAVIAQLAEQSLCNAQVGGAIPSDGTNPEVVMLDNRTFEDRELKMACLSMIGCMLMQIQPKSWITIIQK